MADMEEYNHPLAKITSISEELGENIMLFILFKRVSQY